MASTTKKGSRKTKAKPRRPVVKKSRPKQAAKYSVIAARARRVTRREAATSDILRMIARSPADLQSVLDAIAERAQNSVMRRMLPLSRRWRILLRMRRSLWTRSPWTMLWTRPASSIVARTPGRAIIDRQTIHVHDLRAAEAEFPGAKTWRLQSGLRDSARHAITSRRCGHRRYSYSPTTRFVLFQTDKSSCSKPSPIKR